MIYLTLFLEFFKIGTFAIGGGMATVPFLYALADKYPWYTPTQLADMIALSEATPGPTGINMATAAGYAAGGVLGSFVATFSLVLPALLCILLISRFLSRFYNNPKVTGAFYCLRPIVAAQIAAALFSIMQVTLFLGGNGINWVAIVLYAILTFLVFRYKKHPLVYLALGAVFGILLRL